MKKKINDFDRKQLIVAALAGGSPKWDDRLDSLAMNE